MIGSSIGMAYQDEFHMEASPWIQEPPDTQDNNIVTPSQMDTNKQLDKVEQMEMGGIEIAKKQDMPFPDNNNPDTDFNNRFPNLPKSGILNDIKPSDPVPPLMRKIGWQDNPEDFQNLPDNQYMNRIDKSPGFFLKDEMQNQPWKAYSDRAKDLTKQTYDLYKSGDTDTVSAVQDWEDRTLGRGYNDTDAGKALKKESLNTYGSKTTMSKDAIWETYMTHLQNLAGADMEDEKIPDSRKSDLESLKYFDRVGRPQLDLKPLWAASKYK